MTTPTPASVIRMMLVRVSGLTTGSTPIPS
jgi:hypothetical protein